MGYGVCARSPFLHGQTADALARCGFEVVVIAQRSRTVHERKHAKAGTFKRHIRVNVCAFILS